MPINNIFSTGDKTISGGAYIEILTMRVGKKAGLIKNTDNKCFLWCHGRLGEVVRNLHRVLRRDRDVANTLDYGSISFPVTLQNIPEKEECNNIQVHIFLYNYAADEAHYIHSHQMDDHLCDYYY